MPVVAHPIFNAVVCLGVTLGTLACGAGGAEVLAPQPVGWSAVAWRPCPEGFRAGPIGAQAPTCGHVRVPLNWQRPAQATISVFVRRFSPDGGPVRGQLWALDGGPGDGGDGLSEGWFKETVLAAGFELLVPTHRGVGYGTTLRCEGATDLRGCLKALSGTWGEGIRRFDTHQAARDVVALAKAYPPTAGGGTTRLIFGGSYGGVWLQHVLGAAPTLFDGAYVDSTAPWGSNFQAVGTWSEAVGEGLLKRCDGEPACRGRFVQGAVAAAAVVRRTHLEGGGCLASAGSDLKTLQVALAGLLDGTSERALVAPALVRLLRCNSQDVGDLQHWLNRSPVAAAERKRPPMHNPLLNIVTLHRENYRSSLSPATIRRLAAGHLFDTGAMVALLDRHVLVTESLGPEFPRTAGPAHSATYKGPLHIVAGALDPRSNPAFVEELVALWPDAVKDVVVVADGGHASPRFTQLPAGDSCTSRWLAGFLLDPAGRFDATCLDAVIPMDLAGQRVQTQEAAQVVFGRPDVWGDGARPPR